VQPCDDRVTRVWVAQQIALTRSGGWDLVNGDQSVPSPADAKEPGPRAGDRRPGLGARRIGSAVTPAVEPPSGGELVDPVACDPDVLASLFMPSEVVEDVAKGVPDLARVLQDPAEVAVYKDAAPAAKGAVHLFGETDREALEPPGEAACAERLDDEVKVPPLDRVVNEAEVLALFACAKAGLDQPREVAATKAWEGGVDGEGDVDWVSTRERRPRAVRDAAGVLGLTAGALALASPGPE